MVFEWSTRVPPTRDEVFAWHERPGALVRLTPPWQPVTVLKQAESLRDGVSVLGMPAGLRWLARHAPAAYRPGEAFGDEVVAGEALLSVGRVLRWRHLHTFEDDGDATGIVDRVVTDVPRTVLRRMFRYRERQLVAEFGAHRRLSMLAGAPPPQVSCPRALRIAVTGSSGLVGTQLVAFLQGAGHEVVRLVRRPAAASDEREWAPHDPAHGILDGIDVVVHLAGASIAGRFTAAHKWAVRESRDEPTRLLAQRAAESGAGAFVSASAIGFYGPDRGEEPLTEESSRGEGFLADVVTAWEAASAPASEAGIRTVHVRTGIVQSARGGTLGLYRLLYGVGGGGPVAGGEQWLSWIALDDLVDVYARAVVDAALSGPVNAVAPEPVRGSEYAHTLGRVLRRPSFVPVPALAPRLLLGGEGSRELAEADQRVVPGALRGIGHEFRFDRLEEALRHELGRE